MRDAHILRVQVYRVCIYVVIHDTPPESFKYRNRIIQSEQIIIQCFMVALWCVFVFSIYEKRFAVKSFLQGPKQNKNI